MTCYFSILFLIPDFPIIFGNNIPYALRTNSMIILIKLSSQERILSVKKCFFNRIFHIHEYSTSACYLNIDIRITAFCCCLDCIINYISGKNTHIYIVNQSNLTKYHTCKCYILLFTFIILIIENIVERSIITVFSISI